MTALEVQKRNKERVNVYIDDAFAFALNLMQAAQLRKGQVLSDADIEALIAGDTVQKAVDRAVRFLSYRPRSTQEVRDNLAKKDYPDDVIMAAVERLQNMGYLDDTAFARFWVENRIQFRPRGPQALRYELRGKGVPDAIIETVIDDLLDEEALAERVARERVNRLKGLTRREFRQKIGAYMQRRGFTYSVISSAVSVVMEEIDTEQPDYFAAG